MKQPVRCPAGNVYDAAEYAQCPCASCWADRASSILAPNLARAPNNIRSASNDHHSLEFVPPTAESFVATAESVQENATPSTTATAHPAPKRKHGGPGGFANVATLLIGTGLSYIVALVLATRYPGLSAPVAGLSAFGFFLVGWLVLSRPASRPSAIQSAPFSRLQKSEVERADGCVLRKKWGASAVAPLTIQTPASHNFVLKLVNVLNNDAKEMVIYVRRRAYYESKVPLGTYKIRGAYGGVWRGEKELFGPRTSYFKLIQNASEPFAGANELFTFDRTATGVTGFFVQLVKQSGGNLETSTIGAGEF